MSQPKGKILAHIKPKSFDHPEKSSRIIRALCEVEDPRQPSCNFHHSLVTIIINLFGGLSLLVRHTTDSKKQSVKLEPNSIKSSKVKVVFKKLLFLF